MRVFFLIKKLPAALILGLSPTSDLSFLNPWPWLGANTMRDIKYYAGYRIKMRLICKLTKDLSIHKTKNPIALLIFVGFRKNNWKGKFSPWSFLLVMTLEWVLIYSNFRRASAFLAINSNIYWICPAPVGGWFHNGTRRFYWSMEISFNLLIISKSFLFREEVSIHKHSLDKMKEEKVK